jgi:hypothetical protein
MDAAKSLLGGRDKFENGYGYRDCRRTIDVSGGRAAGLRIVRNTALTPGSRRKKMIAMAARNHRISKVRAH